MIKNIIVMMAAVFLCSGMVFGLLVCAEGIQKWVRNTEIIAQEVEEISARHRVETQGQLQRISSDLDAIRSGLSAINSKPDKAIGQPSGAP